MKTRFRKIDDEISSLHFILSTKEVEAIRSDLASYFEMGKEEFFDLQVEDEVSKTLYDMNIQAVKPYIHYLLPFDKEKKKKPVVGVAMFLNLLDTIKLKFPIAIPRKYSNIVLSERELHYEFENYCNFHELYDLASGNEIDEKSYIVYDLLMRKADDDKVVYRCEDLEYDFLDYQEEFIIPLDMLIGKKVNDKVVSYSDSMLIEITIKEVKNRYLDLDFYYNDFLSADNIKSIEEYEKEFIELYKKYHRINNYIDYVIDQILALNELPYKDSGIDLYKKTYHLFSENTKNTTEDIKDLNAKRCIIFDLLTKIVQNADEIKEKYLLSNTIEDYRYIFEYLSKDDESVKIFYLTKLMIIHYFKYNLEMKGIEL